MKKRISACLAIIVLLLSVAVLAYGDSIFIVFYNGYADDEDHASDLNGETDAMSISTDDSGIKTAPVTDKSETTGIMKDEEQVDSVEYQNTQFGFCFQLPESWKDFTIITGEWEGLPIEEQPGDKSIETGPSYKLRI